ncbi:MAG: ATP-dependent DNA helicase [Methylotenera sp.]|nr:ATP-dependent DNA helicase [Oligoflexia bacterium]
MKRIKLAVRDFALPVPRVGSIDSHSGYGRAQADGQEIHLRVQEKRLKADPTYQAEVKLLHVFERGGYVFEVGGRIDGLFPAVAAGVSQDGSPKPPKPPKIEEIKSSFNIRELSKVLSDQPAGLPTLRPLPTHPYSLQLLTYGYIHWLQNQVMPKLSFHLVSSRNNDSEDIELELDLIQYEQWLNLRLDELVIEAKKSERRTLRRKKISANFPFPFSKPRPGQVELIDEIRKGMKIDSRMLIQAPTGLGKTAGVLYPTLQEALSRGQKVIYVTPKNSQHSVAEDAVTRFQDTGSKLKSLTITAKSKICMKAEPLCNPTYCEFAKDYYTKVAEHELVDKLAKKKKLTSKVFRNFAEEYQVCPFELQLDVAQEADTVICDYNYVFAPRSALGRMNMSTFDQEGKPNLVIDEAHNLPSRAMDYYSPTLSSFVLEKMRDELKGLPSRFRKEAEILIDECIAVLSSCRPDGEAKPVQIDPPVESFMLQDGKLRSFLSRYLESDVEIKPRDPILKLVFYWSEFTGALEFVGDPAHAEFFTTFQPHSSGGTVKITCCDASEMLKSAYDDYEQVVGFSATLKPFKYYSGLSGLDSDTLKTSEFQSPFEKNHRKILIIPQISTKYSDRERNYPKISETVERIVALRKGNYFVFFPSFDFMEKVLNQFKIPAGFTVLRQERSMRPQEVEAVIEHLRSEVAPTLIFAVQGGVFSEGVDYPGNMIIGAFLIGPPLPSFDLEREQMRKFYDERYERAGFDYAYTYPAMAKAVQAAGRVIRSETDRGIIILMDQRFVQSNYAQSMPTDWFESSPRELVSRGILKEISDFWAATGHSSG